MRRIRVGAIFRRMQNVLVAYASKRGSTAEIAEAVADKLRECGLSVDCVPAGDVGTLEPYDAVILGSAVYVSHWPADARHFLRRYADELSGRPFWVFSSGPVGEPGARLDPARVEPARIVDRLEHLDVREHVVFGGRLLAHSKNRLERSLVERTSPGYRDRRDWREIPGVGVGHRRRGRSRGRSRAADVTGTLIGTA
jgi:menaquinone-dependent protoporphyrinogen oxidase